MKYLFLNSHFSASAANFASFINLWPLSSDQFHSQLMHFVFFDPLFSTCIHHSSLTTSLFFGEALHFPELFPSKLFVVFLLHDLRDSFWLKNPIYFLNCFYCSFPSFSSFITKHDFHQPFDGKCFLIYQFSRISLL